jgi:alpha-galactosidase
LSGATISLHDIDAERLRTSEVVAHVAAIPEARPTIEVTADRRRALDGADYVIASSRSAALPSTVIDFDIPSATACGKTIADTLGIGGIMRGLHVPVRWTGSRHEAVCPDARLLNYVTRWPSTAGR